MKKKISIFTVIAVLLIAIVTMTSAAPNNSANNGESTVVIPSVLKSKVIDIAQSNGCINAQEAQALTETDAIQQCTDAFIASGFDPAAAVNKLAEISVETGYYADVTIAKRAMKATAEKFRKNEANWSELYSILGL